MKWLLVCHVTVILGNHMTARELWVKWQPPLACLLSKLEPDGTFYGGVMESESRVPRQAVPALFIINSLTSVAVHTVRSG